MILVVLFFMSLVVFCVYLEYALIIIGEVPWSLSDTYYQLEKKESKSWIFQVTMILSGFFILPVWLEQSNEYTQFLVFLSCGGLMAVGAVPWFKLPLEGKIHYTATAICAISSFVWVLTVDLWWVILVSLVINGIFGLIYKKWMFWIEMAAFMWTYLSIFIHIF